MEKARSYVASLPYLVKSLFSQESHIEFILLACMLATERFEGQKPWLSPSNLHPRLPCPGGGPLLLLSVTLRHAHRWCCCCSACWALLPNTIPPTPGRPPPFPSPLLPDCYSTDVSSTVPFLKLILWRSFFRSAIFPSPQLQLSCFLYFSLSPALCLQGFCLPPLSKIYTLLTPFLFLYLFYCWHLTDDSPNEKGLRTSG